LAARGLKQIGYDRTGGEIDANAAWPRGRLTTRNGGRSKYKLIVAFDLTNEGNDYRSSIDWRCRARVP